MTALLAPFPRTDTDQTTDLMAALAPGFLSLMGWDPEIRVLWFPPGDLLLSGPVCVLSDCSNPAFQPRDRGLCRGCAVRMENTGLSFDQFVATVRRDWRVMGIESCRVAKCERPWMTAAIAVCRAHRSQQKKLQLPLEEFLLLSGLKPLPSFGPCQVVACTRHRHGRTPHCEAHQSLWNTACRTGSPPDEAHWRRVAPAVAETGKVSLRGLSDRVVAEILFSLQQRYHEGIRQFYFQLRPLSDRARALQVASLSELDVTELSRDQRGMVNSMLKQVRRLHLSPEAERHKEVWEGAAFGHKGNLNFGGIAQPWLREAAKAWALEDVPRRRGDRALRAVQEQIKSLAQLSTSLRVNRADSGSDPHRLGRDDIVSFLNRLLFLQETGEVSAPRRVVHVRDTRRLLNRMRNMGLTRPGEPLHGLPGDFSVRPEDIPDDPEDSEAGRDLPDEVMRELCANLEKLDADNDPEIRTAVELLIDTGRRPNEIVALPLDCLDRDGDGKPVLVYDNHKEFRLSRRLPIAEPTAALITTQQQRTRGRFPNTPLKELKLLPSSKHNPNGTKAFTDGWIAERHRAWVGSLPDFLTAIIVERHGQRVTEMVPFDKSKIFPYAYRHSYAQRHAGKGVPIDVLSKLMDHRQLSTTQRYYRVGEGRRREAVERVAAMQFDRNGNRLWRQAQTLLDDEHTRRGLGSVQVPYGICTEPTNVAADGQDCPVRFRCVGCDHFRSDVSYLPDLEAYLADLRRGRERLAAFAADSWATAEAMPSDEEITRVRRLIQRVRADLDDLTEEERAQIQEAVTVVRRSRRVVSLGMPRHAPPLPDLRPERPSA
ncbi:tyrosine-type recombinase/integrase [Streptomyces monticola]|uniref:Tyrosine-type recombinase/integrase n=1 Tax=Streptomyces monticola TaxID=2666263 RepID=A0ABW2JTH7_9ACTN